MAFPSIIPSKLPFPLSPSPPSLLPIIHHPSRFVSFKLNAREECPEGESSPSAVETKNKKKKKKLRPSFYDQTLERWSLKVSSRRSRLPWEERRAEERRKEALPSSLATLDSSVSKGIPSAHSLGNRAVSAPWAHGKKPRDTQLDSEPNSRNPMRNLESSEEGVKSRLDLIVKKMDSSLGRLSSGFDVEFMSTSSVDEDKIASESTSIHSSLHVDGNTPTTDFLGVPLGIRGKSAPWLHGAKPREALLDSAYKNQKSRENFEFAKEDEKPSDSFTQNDSNCAPGESKTEQTSAILPSVTIDESPPVTETAGVRLGNDELDPIETHLDSEVTTRFPLQGHEFSPDSGESSPRLDGGIYFDKYEDEHESKSKSDVNIGRMMGSVSLPWERDGDDSDGDQLHRRSNTELAERTIPEPELRRLRNVALRMKERMKVGPAGVTEAVVESIHKKWKEDEVVKLRFEGPPSLNMKRTHEILERKTGGLVIWRVGTSVVLYRGMAYELPCVQSYSRLTDTSFDHNEISSSNDSTSSIVGNTVGDLYRVSKTSDVNFTPFMNPSEDAADAFDIDSLLDQLGPRYKDWSGCKPLPVDADLLPGVVPGYKPPFRLLPYKAKSSLKNRQMTALRRLARSMSPHFALGRNRQHQGLASAMVKLWEKSAIAKIAIKRGVPNTCNERMAEEIKKLTGGVLLSRNKEYIVFYRGNDYVTPSIREALVKKQKQAINHQDEEEAARLRASALVVSNGKTAKVPLVAGTLAETLEANARWGNQTSSEDREKMMRDLALAKHASLVRYLERKLAFAKAKARKAEKALAKVQEFLNPADLPTDLETVTDEEQFLFRKMGLKMRAFLVLGRRGVFDGTVENMHLNWKHRELVKILVKGKSFPQVKHVAISLEAESGGVLISLDKTTKGYAIIVYRGKNYQRPHNLRPKNLLTRRQALARSIELQRREALNHHISNLRERIELLKSQLDRMEADKELASEHLKLKVDDASVEDVEDEGDEAYLPIYNSGDEDDDYVSIEEF